MLTGKVLRIPNLAIHLNRDANVKFEFNKETQLLPVAGLVSAQLDLPTEPVRVADDGMDERHSIPLLKLIASEAKLDCTFVTWLLFRLKY